MGQKVNPVAFRLGGNKKWDSKWVGSKNYSVKIHNDLNIRKYIDKNLVGSSVGSVEIAQSQNSVEVTIYSGKPAILIGRRGERIDRIKEELDKISTVPVKINVKEIRKPDLNPRIAAESIAEQLGKRVHFKKIIPFVSSRIMDAGASGVKIQISGRLGGAEMKRKEVVTLGTVPLQTISADIDYYYMPAQTDTGVIGVKIWIYKGVKR